MLKEKLLDRFRSMDGVTLREIHAQRPQRREVVDALGMFGDGLLVEHVGDVGDRTYHRDR